MYGLEALGVPIENVKQPDPDPLSESRYLCVYWVDHLYDSRAKTTTDNNRDLQVGGVVDVFLRKKYLYWLEALSLYKSLGKGILSIAKLWSLVQV
jgi:hypothetical protein